jgi:hypothetical protein
MTGNQVYFNGPLVMAANGGNAPRIYAPTTFALGSSCVHLNESTYPAGDPNELMTPFSSAGDANHWPGPLCIAMMQDIGWVLEPDVGLLDHAEAALHVYPNPTTDRITLLLPSGHPNVRVIICDLTGRVTTTIWTNGPIDVSRLPSGLYTLICPALSFRANFIKE